MEQRCFRNQGKSNSCLVCLFVYLFSYLFIFVKQYRKLSLINPGVIHFRKVSNEGL